MRLTLRSITIILVVLSCMPLSFAQETKTKGYRDWWNEGYPGRPRNNPSMKKLPLIQVNGNKFVNSNGDTILFRGLSISDPDKVVKQEHWKKKHFEKVKEMGAMIVRIPVHPVAWRERTPSKYLELLDQVVEWCTELEMYVIIDWHTIGNLKMELFQNPMYDTTQKETFEFWRTIARHFRGHNTVAFYELFNEPTIYRGELGRMSWSEWKKLNEDMIHLIRAYDKETIPLVAGLDWAYDLTPLHIDPVQAEGIGYVTHPYEHKRQKPWEPKWEENFGFAASQYPIIATEFGFRLRKGQEVKDEDYPKAIIKYLEGKGIGWIGWVYDPEWYPRMLESWDTYELTGGGEFFKKALHGEIGN
ncbi:MAG: cellulase family glycosylhydrolase [Phycisphaerales bacterium]